ncbi:transglycosylase domain-containing protein [Streptomyces sp. NPDC058045]|uniref:transglycosylase domain-containing protein n=1 Tax=Streptomyces sp. NPDC058045 TaxID=3346311 RepID=UPI0036F18028
MGRAARQAQRGSPRGIRRFFGWRKILGTFFGLCLLGMAGFAVLYMVVDVPEGKADATRQSNVYRYSDGTLLARTGTVNREIVDLAEVPKDVQRTFVAAENKSFYTDKGIDLKGTARGVFNTLSGRGKQGGSTITQQYVKNYYLDQDQTVTRKLKELVISLKVDQRKSKDEILAGYINTSYYGRGAYGIQAAAQAYYGKDAKELDVAEGAYLAALLQAPNQYDWAIASPEGKRLAKARWNYVLDNMVGQHWLDAGKRRGLSFPVPHRPKPDRGLEGQKGYIVEAARAMVMKQQHLTREQFERGGWTITVTIDRRQQQKLEQAVRTRLTDRLDPKARGVDRDVQAGAVSVDPGSGAVKALYGGPGLAEHWTSNATRADYQPASTFKPVILAAALDRAAVTQNGAPITANTVYDGTSDRPIKGSPVPYAPPNEDHVDYGPVTVQTAMNKSVNSVFAQMGADVGMDKVIETAGKLGMDVKNTEAVPAMTLGSMGASPMEMAGVYATLDHHGKLVTPQIVKSASKEGGAPIELPEAVGDQAISRQAADSVTSVLTGVVDDGTARESVRNSPQRAGQQVAGKTGTSDDNKSAWFTGYTPNLVTSVGLFGEQPKTGKQVSLTGATGGGRVNGGGIPASIWAEYTFAAMGAPSTFELDTDMGAAITPPPATSTPENSATPDHSPPPSEQPSSQPPSSPPPSETGPPSPSADLPSGGPSTQRPPEEPGPNRTGGVAARPPGAAAGVAPSRSVSPR